MVAGLPGGTLDGRLEGLRWRPGVSSIQTAQQDQVRRHKTERRAIDQALIRIVAIVETAEGEDLTASPTDSHRVRGRPAARIGEQRSFQLP